MWYFILGHWICLPIRTWQWVHRPPILLSEQRTCYIRNYRRCLLGVLVVSICLCRYLLNNHIWGYGRSYWIQGRYLLFYSGFWVHLPYFWSLGLGSRWVAWQHDSSFPQCLHTWCCL